MDIKLYFYLLFIILSLSSCSADEEINLTYGESVLVSEIMDSRDPTKIRGFSSFYINNSWKVSEDNQTIYTQEKGIGNRLVNSIITHEDKFDLSASIIAEGETFEVLIGKWESISGTMFGLRKDNNGSFLTTYLISSNNEQTLTNVIKLGNVSLNSGKKIYLTISKRTESASYFEVHVMDENGVNDVLTGIGLAHSVGDYKSNSGKGQYTGFAWGNICAYMLEGKSLQISNLTFGYPVEEELELIVLGHSYVEGNSIMGQKNMRYAYLVCEDIGLDKTLILGQGGQTASSLKLLVNTYSKWFSNARYAIINIGANDFYDNPTEDRIRTCISDCEVINQKLQMYGIEPIWIIDSGYLGNNQNGYNQIKTFTNWLFQQNRYIDARKCFQDSNGNNLESAYLPDGKHPTVAVHHKIYEEIKVQAGYLFSN